ncbi:MAG: DNA replication and repair protein RecF, partial [bacterium]|nr:DNA replication and repair protein RecF [bacterium]
GETRTVLLALKIIEIELIAQRQKPILLLDDVFSELDGHRRRALAERLKDYQTFITTTDADVVIEHFQGKATILPIS